VVRRTKRAFVETKTDSKGETVICDTPLEAVDVVAGVDLCGSVTVNDLKSSWPSPRHLHITYDKVACDHMNVGSQRVVLFRIVDETGQPVSGATLKGRFSGHGAEDSDRLGRIFLLVDSNTIVAGVVSRGLAESTPMSFLVTDDMEKEIVLHNRSSR
jgi:hypothetical protein